LGHFETALPKEKFSMELLMPRLVWNTAWNQQLFSLTNQIFMAAHSDESKVDLPELMIFLSDYVDAHFREEEQTMTEYNYPGLENHRAVHDALRNRVENLLMEFQSGSPTITDEVIGLLADWLITSMEKTERWLIS
jgi:hemerythrin